MLLYRQDKTTQAAELFLELRGGRMSYLKLMKLLYLADRETLHRWGRPITFDSYASMDKGPILSTTLNLMTDEPSPSYPSYWQDHIVTDMANHEVVLERATSKDQLSEAERNVIRQVFRDHGQKSRWQLVDFTHTLPEWRDSHGSSLPIEIRDILVAGGWTEEDARDAIEELEAENAARRLWT